MADLSVVILSPTSREVLENLEKVILPSIEGDMTILPGHISLITELNTTKETIVFTTSGEEKKYQFSNALAVIEDSTLKIIKTG
jgi:F-type H+-transporting ATPase subunit epsilon